ncbi:hypothetical protein GC175_08985 [bacterium]|nr:hypothetical protein [bacterium]
MKSLVDALGEVDAARFVSLMLREPSDYTKWQRHLWEDRTVEEISQAAMNHVRDEHNNSV